MKKLGALAGALGFLCLILDSRTAIQGASEGISVCLHSVIPAMFPFFVLSSMMTGSISGCRFLRPVGKLCRIPAGAESLFLTGLLSGYPNGARCIWQACRNGSLSRTDVERMMGFCCNAGPAFLFGIGAALFDRTEVLVCLWMIHILSAVLTGILLPGSCGRAESIRPGKPVSLTDAVKKSTAAIAVVCGWILLFRVLGAFLDRWVLWLFPETIQICIRGSLELTNGFLAAKNIPEPGIRFVLCAAFLSFGGLCVAMQTRSVSDSMGLYFPGKLLQTCISILLAWPVQQFLFHRQPVNLIPEIAAAAALTAFGTIICLYWRKNRCGNLCTSDV